MIAYSYPDQGEPGLREIDPETGQIVGLEYWNTSRTLPHDLLAMLPPPTVPAAA